jgi:hypothetical protein
VSALTEPLLGVSRRERLSAPNGERRVARVAVPSRGMINVMVKGAKLQHDGPGLRARR